MEKNRAKNGALTRSSSLQVTDVDHSDKNKMDKKKHSPVRTIAKNGKTEGQIHSTTRRKSNSEIRLASSTKSDTKKHTSSDVHTKTSHTGNIFPHSSTHYDQKRVPFFPS